MVSKSETLVVPARGAPMQPTPVILDSPRHDELLVEIHATGICHTDVACMKGNLPAEFPAVLGHEGDDIAPGDKVILSYDFCRTCAQCVTYCENIVLLNFGGRRADESRTITLPLPSQQQQQQQPVFANFFRQSSFARVPPSTDLARFAPLGCGRGGATVIQCIGEICAAAGSSNGVQYAIDCTGTTAVVGTMLDCLGTRGRGASVGGPPPGARAGYLGRHQGASVAEEMIPYPIKQNLAGKFHVEKMITYYAVEDHERAFEDLKQG
ncbi:chaperonin 10-like protein [Aspergillus filifer]